MTFRIGHFQPKIYFSALKNARFTFSPSLEVLDEPVRPLIRWSVGRFVSPSVTRRRAANILYDAWSIKNALMGPILFGNLRLLM